MTRQPLVITIRKDDLLLAHPSQPVTQRTVGPDEEIAGTITAFCREHGLRCKTALLFVSEELLFFKKLTLPAKTPDLRKTIEYQLELLTPFAEGEILYGYTTTRGRNGHLIHLVAGRAESILPVVDRVRASGLLVDGLYPESQRYVTRRNRRRRWAMILPGRFGKGLVFSGLQLEDRFLCSSEPNFSEFSSLTRAEAIYHFKPPADSPFEELALLGTDAPQPDPGFNLLPVSYRRPDYTRTILTGLAVANCLLLIFLVASRFQSLTALEQRLDRELAEVAPQVQEVKTLYEQHRQGQVFIDQFAAVGPNPDLIGLFGELTTNLPVTSYLERFTLPRDSRLVQIDGYTDNIAALSAALQTLGDTQLKSTRRRQDQTFFQMEVKLP